MELGALRRAAGWLGRLHPEGPVARLAEGPFCDRRLPRLPRHLDPGLGLERRPLRWLAAAGDAPIPPAGGDASFVPPGSGPLPPALEGLRILHVDDQQVVLDTVEPLLRGLGLVVTSMVDPMKALERLRARDHDLLITDLKMPRLDGVSLVNRAIEEGLFVPTLFLSGSQASTQAAVLLEQLDNGYFEARGLPVRYLKKEPQDLKGRLRTKLLQLAGMRQVSPAGVPAEFPKLRSIFVETASSPMGSSTREIYRDGCEAYVDLRFSVYHRLAQFLDLLRERVGARDSSKLSGSVNKLGNYLSQGDPYTLADLLTFGRDEWHHYGNVLFSLTAQLDNLESTLQDLAGREGISEARTELKGVNLLVNQLAGSAKLVHSFLRGAVEEPEVVEVQESVQFVLRFLGRDYDFESAVSVPPTLALNLPPSLIRAVLTVLVQNAVQATPRGRERPVVHAAIVEEGGSQHLSLSVVNQAEREIPAEIRDRMLRSSFTTKTHGSGFGLMVVKNFMDRVGGRPRIVSTDRETEIGLLIPIS